MSSNDFMLYVDVSGLDNEELSNRYAHYAEDILCDLLSASTIIQCDLSVDIEFHDELDNQCAGYCSGDAEENLVEIAVNSQGEPYTEWDIAKHIAHELVHVAQNVRGGVAPAFQKLVMSMPTSDDIRELEAYYLENRLREKYWHK